MFSRAQDHILRALRWSEKYTKTDMVYLARGGSLAFAGQGIALLASLTLAVAVSHFVSKEAYGVSDIVIPIGVFIGVVLVTDDPLALIATYFLANALAGLYFFRRTIKVYHADLHKHDDALIGYSKHLSVMGIVSGIANNLD